MLPAEGVVAPPAPAVALTKTEVPVRAIRLSAPALTSAASAISAVVMAFTTLTPTLAPKAAACGVASDFEVTVLRTVRVVSPVTSSLAEPPMRAIAVLLMVETATAPSADEFTGASDWVTIEDCTSADASNSARAADTSVAPVMSIFA